MFHRSLRALLAALVAFSAFFLAPAPAHADTFNLTTNPVATVPGGTSFTVTGRVSPAPGANSIINFDGFLPDGTYQGNFAQARANADGTWSFTTSWGAGTPGLFQIRSAYCDTTGVWHRSDYQYFSRDNQISMSNPLQGASFPHGTTGIAVTGTTYPARGGDTVIIDVVDSTNTYYGGVVTVATKADGSWSTTINISSYPLGALQVRAAVSNGWWARTNYVTVTLN